MPRPKRQNTAAESGKNAIVYLRVSKEDRDDKNGLEVQEDACREYARRLGYAVVDVRRDDGYSGTLGLEDRPGLAQAIALCGMGRADVLLSYAQDRIARRVGLFDEIRTTLTRMGVRLETVKEAQDFTRDEALLMGDIYAAFAAEERRRIAARLLGGRRVRSKRDGRGSGPLPYGYVRQDGAIVVDRAAAKPIRRLFALREKGATYQAVADALTAAGYPTPGGGARWAPGQVQNIERHRDLYATGRRQWSDVEAEDRWPKIL